MDKNKSSKERKTGKKRMVNFQFQAPEADSVFLVGSFNDWDSNAKPMKKDSEGIWNKKIKLSPGTYEYLFYVDDRWENDPNEMALIENPFGTANNLRVVN